MLDYKVHTQWVIYAMGKDTWGSDSIHSWHRQGYTQQSGPQNRYLEQDTQGLYRRLAIIPGNANRLRYAEPSHWRYAAPPQSSTFKAPTPSPHLNFETNPSGPVATAGVFLMMGRAIHLEALGRLANAGLLAGTGIAGTPGCRPFPLRGLEGTTVVLLLFNVAARKWIQATVNCHKAALGIGCRGQVCMLFGWKRTAINSLCLLNRWTHMCYFRLHDLGIESPLRRNW